MSRPDKDKQDPKAKPEHNPVRPDKSSGNAPDPVERKASKAEADLAAKIELQDLVASTARKDLPALLAKAKREGNDKLVALILAAAR